jgi:hypothetical protein
LQQENTELPFKQVIQATIPAKHMCDNTGLNRITTSSGVSLKKWKSYALQEVIHDIEV